jgi:ABC-type glutathione transport system ATPase component
VSEPTPVIEVKNIQKSFTLSGPWPWSEKTEIKAVNGVNISVQPGEIIALVGQSGSGKTTLSRIILGLEEPSSGEIWLNGMRWDHVDEATRRAFRPQYQYVPQDAMGALNPQQTALEHISETYRVLAKESKETATSKAKALLSSLGLKERLQALPREMSGGEQRRVTLARVLALDPKLVVADEPTSGLDPERRDAVLHALFGNLPASAACVLVTHDMSEAKEWCHRIYVMLEGKVVEEIDMTCENPKPTHPYAQALFDPWSEEAGKWLEAHKQLD